MRLRIFSKRDAGNRLLPAVVLAGSVVLYGALTMAARGRGSVLEDRRLERDRYGGDERQYELLVEGLSGERELPVTVRVGARTYSEEEAEEVFIRLMDGMEERIRGENASLMDIRTDLTLPKWFEEEGIRASWYSSDGELLDAAGKLGQQVTENQELTLSVALSDGIHKSTYEIPVRLVPGEQTGEEKLVGRGDMLYFPLGTGKPQRVQGCLISDEEVASVVGFIKRNSGSADYDDEILHEIEQNAAAKEKTGKGVGGSTPEDVDAGYDELLPSAIEVVVETGMASVSMLQRRLKLGYARAARLVDQLEEKGIVGPFEGSKPRKVLITKQQWMERQNQTAE